MISFFNKYYRYILALIPAISLLMHCHVFKLDLIGIHVWRQTQTQTVISNFYSGDFNILHPKINDKADTDQIIRMEFPIMQWLFALTDKIFGYHVYISRILTFLLGLFSVYGIFYLCKAIFKSNAIGVIAAWAFNFSPVFYYYTVNPLPDNFAMCAAIWSMGLFFKNLESKKWSGFLLSSSMLCLATLAKLPFVLFGSAVVIGSLVQLKNKVWNGATVFKIFALYAVIALPAIIWYGTVIPTWDKNGIVSGITNSQYNIGYLLDVFQFTLVSTLPELLINYGSLLFFICGFYFLIKNKLYKRRTFIILSIWSATIAIYFLYEINMIDKIHDYYLFPFLPPIFIIVAYGAYRLLAGNNKALKYFSVVALCILPVTAFLRIDTRWNVNDPGFNAVYYKDKTRIRNLIPEHAFVIAGNDDSHFILLYYINRKGWAFNSNNLTPDQLKYYISKGAAYLFIDDELDNNPDIKCHLSERIFERESLRIYKLK